MSSNTPLLEMKGVEKHFGGVRAIDHFDLQVMPRDIYGLIGPNGAGKTTIFNTITGIYQADAGQSSLTGRISRRSSRMRLRRSGSQGPSRISAFSGTSP